jgi:DNA-binding NarL/FixJ family response regulator
MVTPGISARRILVVDDDPLVCDSIRRMLAVDGHVVETASSGEAALELFQKAKFDLIIVSGKAGASMREGRCQGKVGGDETPSKWRSSFPRGAQLLDSSLPCQ